jgi:ADP-heptose:LPS heptosyltransferase
MKKIGIIQPGRIGDIIIILPAIKHLKKDDTQIFWPIYEQYIWMFTDVIDYVTFIPVKYDVYNVVKECNNILKNIYKCDEIIDTAATFPDSTATKEYVDNGDGWKEPFDVFKYKKLNIDIACKYGLKNCLNRNYKKEHELYTQLVKNEKYAVAFLSCSNGKYNVQFDVQDGQLIEVEESYNIFHWIEILENANTIITLNSGPLCLVEQLNLSKPKKILFKIPNGKLPLLQTKWDII